MINDRKFEGMMNLMAERKNTANKLLEIDKTLEDERKACSHIELIMGYHMDEVYNCCLICGAKNIMPTQYSVDASEYLPDNDFLNDSEFDQKFNKIQKIAHNLISIHNEKNIEDSVLVDELNNAIRTSIEEESVKKLVK